MKNNYIYNLNLTYLLKTFLIVALILLPALSCQLLAQTPTAEQAQRELKQFGLEDQEVKDKLAERGIDVDNININDPEQIFKLERNLAEVIKELENEQIKSTIDSKNDGTPLVDTLDEEEKKVLVKEVDDITESLDDGKTLEEAVAEELNESLQNDIDDATLYGQEIFRAQRLRLYTSSRDVKPPGTYILGSGDVISISIWGRSERDFVFELGKDGYIKPSRIPRIYLKGLRLDDARELLKKRFSNYFSFDDNTFEMTLNYGRTINVDIVGEVYNFGTFNIPAINSAFNALVAAGGPNEIGSVRNIRLLRAGQPGRDIDVYKYLKDPNYAVDLYLEEGDVLSVPVAQKVVKIEGAVIRPHRYELKPNEDLISLLEFCGGLKSNASLRNIQIRRYDQDAEKIIDVNLNQIVASNSDVKLRNGDVIVVNEISRSFENYVTINGAIEIPGQYAISNNTTLRDVLSKTNLNNNALLDIAYLERTNPDGSTVLIRTNLTGVLNDRNHPDNLLLQAKDKLVIYEQSRFVDQETFKISGAVREPGEFNFDSSNSLRLSDAIFLAGGAKKDATDFIYLHRKDPNDLGGLSYLRKDYASILANPDSPENILLAPGDEIVVYSKKDFLDEKTVFVEGAVRSPGSFTYDPSLTIKDLITMSGGLKFSASRKRVDIYRLAFEDEQKTRTLSANLILDENDSPINGEFGLKPFDKIIVREAPEFETIKTVQILGEVKYPGEYALISDNESIASLIQRAGGPTPEAFLSGSLFKRAEDNTGFVSVDLEQAYSFNNSRHNIVLKANDLITIPKKRDLVTIQGQTKASELYQATIAEQEQVNVPYVSGKDAKYYVDEFAGGINDKGDKWEITVRYPNGTLKRTKRVLFWKKYPPVEKGSVITVGTKKVEKEADNEEKEPVDWGQFFRDTIAAVTAVLTLIVLAQRID